MVKCPFCGFGNEDGALFCEQCKSDISGVAPAPPAEPIPVAAVEAAPEAPIVAEVVSEPIPAAAVMAEPPPVAQVEAAPAPELAAPAPEPAPADAAAPAPPPAAPKPAVAAVPIPAGSQPKFVVQRGLKINEEFNIYPGDNYVGRADEKPVDIDLTFQEPEDRVWTSRQHALVVFDDATGSLTIEDLNSANGTFVNRERVYPGQPKPLAVGSTVQIGTVHMRVKV